MSDKIRVGQYQLGFRLVDLYLNPNERGGNFMFIPEKGEFSRIEVGADYRTVDEAHAILTHEVMEAALADIEARVRPTSVFVEGCSDVYSFHFDHSQFTEVAARVSYFLYTCHEAFQEAFWKYKKDQNDAQKERNRKISKRKKNRRK